MARAMLEHIPERAKSLILTGAISCSSMFLLADDSGVTRPNYKDLTQWGTWCWKCVSRGLLNRCGNVWGLVYIDRLGFKYIYRLGFKYIYTYVNKQPFRTSATTLFGCEHGVNSFLTMCRPGSLSWTLCWSLTTFWWTRCTCQRVRLRVTGRPRLSLLGRKPTKWSAF